jgi:hypothetical protein
VELALPGVLSRVVDVEEDDAGDGDDVHEAGRRQQGNEPAAAVGLFVVADKVF